MTNSESQPSESRSPVAFDRAQPSDCACAGACRPLTRRGFLATLGAAAGATLLPAIPRAVAGPFTADDTAIFPIPPDKKFTPAWLNLLTARGEPTAWRKTRQQTHLIGMPVGGIGCGQLYLGGDGRLWHWDIFNVPPAPDFRSTHGPHHAVPARPASPIEHGFALRVAGTVRPLDVTGWDEVEFRGQYPIAGVTFRDGACPLRVVLEAFSPFIPLHEDDSSLPATFLSYKLHNDSDAAVEADLLGWIENPVCLSKRGDRRITRVNRVVRDTDRLAIECSARVAPVESQPRPQRSDIVFEDFESGTYANWTATGTAFGDEPMPRARMPAYQGDVNAQGERLVNTHQTRGGEDVRKADTHIGSLTSIEFTIDRDFIRFRIGGGNHPARCCVNLLIDGAVVRSATGQNNNRMRIEQFDVREFAGAAARIQIMDGERGGWGQIGCDEIVFTDAPAAEPFVLDEQPDFGTLSLALLDPPSSGALSAAHIAAGTLPLAAFDAPRNADEHADAGAPIGRVGAAIRLGPGESRTLTFVLAWHFSGLWWDHLSFLPDYRTLRREYARRFRSSADVLAYVARERERLMRTTRLWRDTWYESTLPHWLLDRLFTPLCCLATGTALRFDNGRFYGWEGVYCCAGTCTHVWQYAQSVARIFPALERSTREMIDFGREFNEKTGLIHYRGEAARELAIDGQAGTILRAYREHTMSADDGFLKRIWPRVRRAVELLIERDTDADGILDGAQYNTLDTTWHGQIAWLSSLYIAALRAAAAMAGEMADADFSAQCTSLAERGGESMVSRLFNGEHFIQRVDPATPQANSTGAGCHADQLLGQSWAHQVALGRVVPLEASQSALRAIYRYNLAPDIGPYRARFDRVITNGRWYAMPGEGGLLMCTWPKGGIEAAAGKSADAWAAGYFNESWTGFEYQVASHMIWEGLLPEGLAVVRLLHERHDAARRNPYNEIECSDHYARAMSSHGVFLALCGYEYHGPRGRIAFAPRVSPEQFRAAFTAAEGWGTFEQVRGGHSQRQRLILRYGRLRLREIGLTLPDGITMLTVIAKLSGTQFPVRGAQNGAAVVITLDHELVVETDNVVEVEVFWR